MDKLLLRVGGAAEMLAISRSKAYEMIAAGELRYMKLRGSIRIVQRDLVYSVALALGLRRGEALGLR